jgi:6-phosphogluconolactonase
MDDNWVYIGTYTRPNKSEGIYLLHVDPMSGALSQPTLVAKTTSPSFVAIHPNHRFLYCVNEVSDFGGKKSGAVSAFSIDPKSGMLTSLNSQASGGDGPCYVSLDHSGKVALVANYGSGSVASFPVGDDGKLKEAATIDQHMGKGPNRQRQEGPHAHCFDMDPANHFAISADLGLDKLFVYKLDPSSGKLTPNDPPAGILPPGSGPRHVAFSKDSRFIYAINEVLSTITAFQYDAAKGAMKQMQTISTLPPDFHGNNTTAEIIIHPSGKFLYGSNRGHDSLAIFSIDATSGKLTAAGHQSTQGKTPRGFNIHPAGNVLIAGNQDTDNVVSYQIDQNTGALKPTSSNVQIGSPVHVIFLVK